MSSDGLLRIVPRRFPAIATVGEHNSVALPHLLLILVSTALTSRVSAPICIILPATGGIAQVLSVLVSIECLAAGWEEMCRNFVERQLKPGTRVRSLPDGYVYEVAGKRSYNGTELLTLNYIDKANATAKGSISISIRLALRYEPTLRRRPIARANSRINPPRTTLVDELAGVRTYGNTALIHNRVILIAPQAEFERVLKDTRLRPASKEIDARVLGTLEDVFPRGGFDTDGTPIVAYPPGAAGQPMVAVSRDMLALEAASLGRQVMPATQIVITDRLDLVLRNLDLAGRVGEKHRLLVLAAATHRQDAMSLKAHGWIVWEPGPEELLPVGTSLPSKIIIPGIDRVHHSAMAEVRQIVGWIERKSGALAGARVAVEQLGELLSQDAAETDERLQEMLDDIRGLFFRAANWLEPPDGPRLDDCSRLLGTLSDGERYVRRFVGEEAGSSLRNFINALDGFIRSHRSANLTPKGASLLDLARSAARSADFKQVLVTGSRTSREEADAFFQRHAIPLKCMIVRDLLGSEQLASVVVFSVMRRDLFATLIDPWPAKSLIFAGYDFEIDVYRRRLEERRRLRESCTVATDRRTALTGLPPEMFAHHQAAGLVDGNFSDPKLTAFDHVTAPAAWRWSKRITIPKPALGETTVEAIIVRFIGRSWMAVTDEHRSLALVDSGVDSSNQDATWSSQVELIELADIRPGTRLVIREGSEKDMIRLIGEQRIGIEKYNKVKEVSSLWRKALRASGLNASSIERNLAMAGVRRHVVTVRSWLVNDALIGPRSDDDVTAIGEAFPVAGKTDKDWRSCCHAISELRSLHLSAGSKLSELLAERCGAMLFEPSDTEIAVDLGIGTVWVTEVGEVDVTTVPVPLGYTNRLQWTDPAWRARLLDQRVRSSAPLELL
jgi:hypothetical protein